MMRRDRLDREDRRIARCPLCGSWTYRGECGTPHRPDGRSADNVGLST